MSVTVKPKQIKGAGSDLTRQGGELYELKSLVGNVKSLCNAAGVRNYNINSSLDNIMSRLELQGNRCKTMGRSLENISKQYVDCERKILGEGESYQELTDDDVAFKGFKGGGGSSFDDGKGNKWRDIFNLTGKLGTVGSAVSMLNTLADLDSLDDVFKLGGLATKYIAGGAKLIEKGAAVKWNDWLGISDNLSKLNLTSGGTAFGSTLKKELIDSYWSLGEGSKAVGAIGVAAKWLGAGLSFGGNYVKYGEEEGVSQGRVFTRAALETAIDIGVDAGIKAGITAGATAIFGGAAIATGAPAIAIGAAAVGVSWLANTAFEHATGKDIGEWAVVGVETVADAAVTGARWVGEQAEKVGDKAVSVVKSVRSGITSGIRNINIGWNSLVAAF